MCVGATGSAWNRDGGCVLRLQGKLTPDLPSAMARYSLSSSMVLLALYALSWLKLARNPFALILLLRK